MNLFELTLRANGFPIREARKEYAKIRAISETDYPAFIQQKKQEIVAYHLQHNSFYKALVSSKTVPAWNDLPVLTKSHYQQALANRLSTGFTLNNVFKNSTSGSGGNPFSLARDKKCHALTWAAIIEQFGWYGIDFNHSLQARYYGISLASVANKKVRLKDFLSKRHRFSILDLSDRALAEMLTTYQKKPFNYINGYTSSIVLFAKYLRKQKIRLCDVCPTLKVCVVTSEMLFETDRKLLEEQFGVPVVNEYGCAEVGVIAFTNPSNEWEVNSETLFVEILDDDHQPVPLGTEGNIVVTALFNRAHPFIRYAVGDRGVLSEKSTLKTPLLSTLTGRTNDIARLPSGKKAAGMTFYVVTKAVMEANGSIKEFVVTQTKKDTFEILYVSDSKLSEEKIKYISETLETYLEPGLTFNFYRKKMLQRSKSGKLKQFTSNL